jgi:hypothetical protein
MVIAEQGQRAADRLREIREAHVDGDGEPMYQAEFARLLQNQGERMYGDLLEHKFSPSLVNRLENAGQPPTLQDIAIYAAVDPHRRGKLWAGWGEREDSSMLQERGASVIRPALPTNEELAAMTGATVGKPRKITIQELEREAAAKQAAKKGGGRRRA